jgi:hypothetical protein
MSITNRRVPTTRGIQRIVYPNHFLFIWYIVSIYYPHIALSSGVPFTASPAATGWAFLLCDNSKKLNSTPVQ